MNGLPLQCAGAIATNVCPLDSADSSGSCKAYSGCVVVAHGIELIHTSKFKS